MTITELRKNIYAVFDDLLESGKSIEITRNGKKIIISPQENGKKMERIKKPSQRVFKGNSDEILTINWEKQWHGKLI